MVKKENILFAAIQLNVHHQRLSANIIVATGEYSAVNIRAAQFFGQLQQRNETKVVRKEQCLRTDSDLLVDVS